MCNCSPTSHWTAVKALACVSKPYGATKHVFGCKGIIQLGYIAWYHGLACQKTQRKKNIQTLELEIGDDIASTHKVVTEKMSFKKRRTCDDNVPTPNSAHPSREHQPTLERFSYSDRSNKGQQSTLVKPDEALYDTAITQMIHGFNLPLSCLRPSVLFCVEDVKDRWIRIPSTK
jgi:hypothetical protein